MVLVFVVTRRRPDVDAEGERRRRQRRRISVSVVLPNERRRSGRPGVDPRVGGVTGLDSEDGSGRRRHALLVGAAAGLALVLPPEGGKDAQAGVIFPFVGLASNWNLFSIKKKNFFSFRQ